MHLWNEFNEKPEREDKRQLQKSAYPAWKMGSAPSSPPSQIPRQMIGMSLGVAVAFKSRERENELKGDVSPATGDRVARLWEYSHSILLGVARNPSSSFNSFLSLARSHIRRDRIHTHARSPSGDYNGETVGKSTYIYPGSAKTAEEMRKRAQTAGRHCAPLYGEQRATDNRERERERVRDASLPVPAKILRRTSFLRSLLADRPKMRRATITSRGLSYRRKLSIVASALWEISGWDEKIKVLLVTVTAGRESK